MDVDDFFIAFYSTDEVKDSCRIPLETTAVPIPSVEPDDIRSEVHSIKMIMGEYFENIAFATNGLIEKVNALIQKQNEMEMRISKIELVTESTIEEIIQYYLYIFQNTGDDLQDLKRKLLDDMGKNSMLFTLKKIEKTLEPKEVDPSIKKKIRNMIEAIETDINETRQVSERVDKLQGQIKEMTVSLNERNTENRKLQDIIDKLGYEKEQLQNRLKKKD